jgi:hypothetical protein
MSTAVRATYDGKVLVPERPLDLKVGEVIVLPIAPAAEQFPSQDEIERRLALHRAASGIVTGPTLSDEALSRESIYEDRV